MSTPSNRSHAVALVDSPARVITNVVVVLLAAVFLFSAFPTTTAAQQLGVSNQTVSGWIPWWTPEAGAQSAEQNIDALDVIYPFVYEVGSDDELVAKSDLNEPYWRDLFRAARRADVDIVPTVAWFDGPAIHAVLSDDERRERHIQEIVAMVEEYNVDGVNIDYEKKRAETIDHFSDFLAELNRELGSADLTCTVEPRMRPDHRWRPGEVPETIAYANDYQAMSRHCDWVEIMGYDQQRADLFYNALRRGVPYSPVADTDWVEHILEFALEDFDAKNVVLGVPTYGRAWDVTVAADWYRDYDRVASLNHPRIMELAEKYDAPIGRTGGGEAVITYFPEDSPWRLLNQLPTPEDTPVGYEAAAKALLVATYADIEIPVRMIIWSDATAIAEKRALAEEYDLHGIALFKIDGEEDPELWEEL